MKQLLASPAARNWQKIQMKHHHGINTPLFSLRSRLSSGIGEYLDLLPLIEWCQEIGFDILQLLPINDSGLDPSPYNAISSKALHPIYLSLHALPNINKYPELLARLQEFHELNLQQRGDYLEVLNKKEAFLQYYFNNEFDGVFATPEYQKFVEQNPWLTGYALFKYFKSHYSWQNWQNWPKDFSSDHDPRNLSFHIFVQFLCFSQMTQVKAYANQHNVYIKGDIPILISPDSADVWYEPRYFDLSYSAGAPPDVYCEQGQDWGFPLYDYVEQEKDNFKWWRERLAFASQFYDLYRLDHIIGFYRIWAVKRGDLAINGRFIPEDRVEWLPQGEKLLKMMLESAPSMLPIGEDLGVVPDSIRISMRTLGICGTKVIRWQREWNEGGKFINPKDYIPESMTTVSTHDSETLELWWKDEPAEAMAFAQYMDWEYNAPLSKEEHVAILRLSHHSGSLFHINLLQEYLDLFPEFSWENPEDERINIPGVITSRNWSFRYKPFLEDMIQHEALKIVMANLIK